MSQDDPLQPMPIVYEQSSISFPLNEESFKDFMVSLLGQPETINASIEGAFEIDFDGFNQLNQLIDNRISKQNLSSLIDFRAKLIFDDESLISINGIQSFLEYKEYRSVICKGFIFTWTYLIKFHDKDFSEKQEISISSVEEEFDESDKSKRKKSQKSLFNIGIDENLPKINFYVKYSERGWGVEILEMVRRSLSVLTSNNRATGKNVRTWILDNFNDIKNIFYIVGIFLLFAGLWSYLGLNLPECKSLLNQTENYLDDGIEVDEKIEFLISMVSACDSDKKNYTFASFAFMMTAIMSVVYIIPAVLYRLVRFPSYRFLLFTPESRKERNEYFRKQRDMRTFWIVTVLLSLVMGVLGNYIFAFLTGG